MTKPSESQKNYIRTVRRRRRTVQFMRSFLFLFFVFYGKWPRIFVDRQLYFQQSAADRKNRLADASGWKPDHAHRCDAL